MADKNVSELLNIVRAGAGVTLTAENLTVDDVMPVARAAGEANVPLRVRGALQWRTHDLVQIAKAGNGQVIFE
jgi:antitoxin (DNA-binding transcriptional repressor) of toxin-antitoxin stability system